MAATKQITEAPSVVRDELERFPLIADAIAEINEGEVIEVIIKPRHIVDWEEGVVDYIIAGGIIL